MIKILTLLGNNYGGCLQAVALQQSIKKLKKDVITINYLEYLNENRTIKGVIKRTIYFKRDKKFNSFRKKYLNLTDRVKDLVDDGKSVYIVGSDQVWNPNINFDIRKKFYLDFVTDNRRKFSYAASIGDEKLDKDGNEKIFIDLLKKINIISIRELSSVNLLKKKFNIESVNVLDPTLLLSKTEWDEYKSQNFSKSGYILVYTLGMNKNCNKYIDEFSNLKGKKILDVFYKKRFKNTKFLENGFGPSEFISAIDSADIVVTNSFHGTVFSLIFHKDFYVITRSSMNSRIYDLLKLFDLEDRIIKEDEIYLINEKKFKPIDYELVDKKILEEQNKSMDFLRRITK